MSKWNIAVITIDQAIDAHESPNDLRAVAHWNMKAAANLQKNSPEQKDRIAQLQSQSDKLRKVADHLENYYGGYVD